METVHFLAFTKVKAILQNHEPRHNLRILLCSLLCLVPQPYFLFKERYPVPLPGSCVVQSIMPQSVTLRTYVWRWQNAQGDSDLSTEQIQRSCSSVLL